MEHQVGHQPKHLFDPARAASLLDPQQRFVADPLALVQEMGGLPGMRVVDLGRGPGFFTHACEGGGCHGVLRSGRKWRLT